jgi:threonine/homoserine/homoserine lactone efflux protein
VSELFLSLLAFALVSTLSPGGATTLATASGAQFGLLRSLPLLAGIAIGLASLMGAAALGLGSLAAIMPRLEIVLRVVGSAYFLWLAWTIARQGAPAGKSRNNAKPIGFAAGLLLLWVNPKAWTMAISAVGSFARLTDSPTALAALLAAIFGGSAALSLTIWCLGGSWIAGVIHAPAAWRAVNISLALLLVISIAMLWL